MPVWRGAASGALTGVKKNAVILSALAAQLRLCDRYAPRAAVFRAGRSTSQFDRYGTANGSLAAGYFNPQSIHVAQAEASREGGVMKVFIELRDVNYPGSTYTLTYDPASDQLKGVYYQAVEKQRFPVAYVRMK